MFLLLVSMLFSYVIRLTPGFFFLFLFLLFSFSFSFLSFFPLGCLVSCHKDRVFVVQLFEQLISFKNGTLYLFS